MVQLISFYINILYLVRSQNLPNPISNQAYLNPLDLDFYLDLYQIMDTSHPIHLMFLLMSFPKILTEMFHNEKKVRKKNPGPRSAPRVNGF